MRQMTWEEFALRYCDRQEQTQDGLKEVLKSQYQQFGNVGWMLLECQMWDSSLQGSLTIMPYGPRNTYKEPTTWPISPRGLASDMSICVGVLLVPELLGVK